MIATWLNDGLNRFKRPRVWIAIGILAAGLLVLFHLPGTKYGDWWSPPNNLHSVNFAYMLRLTLSRFPAALWPALGYILAQVLLTTGAVLWGGRLVTRGGRILSLPIMGVVVSGMLIQTPAFTAGNATPWSYWLAAILWWVSAACPSISPSFNAPAFEAAIECGFILITVAAWISPARSRRTTGTASQRDERPELVTTCRARRWSRLAVASALITTFYLAYLLLFAHDTIASHLTRYNGLAGIGPAIVYALELSLAVIATPLTFITACILAATARKAIGSSNHRLKGRGLLALSLSAHLVFGVGLLIYWSQVRAQYLRYTQRQAEAYAKAEVPINEAQSHMQAVLALLQRYAANHHGYLPYNLGAIVGNTHPTWFSPGDYYFPAAGLPVGEIHTYSTTWKQSGFLILVVDKKQFQDGPIVFGAINSYGEWISEARSYGTLISLGQTDDRSRAALHWAQLAGKARKHMDALLGMLRHYATQHHGRLPDNIAAAVGNPSPTWFNPSDYDFPSAGADVANIPVNNGKWRQFGFVILAINRQQFPDGSLVVGAINSHGKWMSEATESYDAFVDLIARDRRSRSLLRWRQPAIASERTTFP